MIDQKKFGVWMDNNQAAIVGSDNSETGNMVLLAHVKGEASQGNSNEKNSNNHEKTVQSKYFKEIASHMVNATQIHVTGTGQVQEQFIKYLAATPQFKKSRTAESTSNKMSDENLITFIASKF